MKKTSILGLFVFLFSLFSCAINEEVFVKNSGEIDYRMNLDFTQFLEMIPAEELDSLKQISEFTNNQYMRLDDLMLKMAKNQTDKDSIQLLIQENKSFFDKTKNLKWLFQFDDQVFQLGYEIKAKSLQDFSNELKTIREAYLEFADKEPSMNLQQSKAMFNDLTFSMDKKHFRRSEISNEWSKLAAEEKNDSMDMNSEILQLFTVNLKYHFEKPIRSVNLENAVIADDKKSFTYSVSLQDITENSNLDFEVEFE